MQKSEERLRNLWDNFRRSNIRIMGVPEGEEEEQDIENLLEQIMENFSNLVKELSTTLFPSRKPRESQRNWTQGEAHQGTSWLSYAILKIKRESLKQQEERTQLPTKEFP